ncbi:hypothetical protein RchiOBHm_Chr5g0082261 [Rosa chinensis]|uniref:Uncharacterized protein n=1 Tax=Rosa chinensis TaxID=74649 RepID=A0A2P6QNA6_ROSCH|nr:hypothetical protein RchiOBHm_Chr5g0082261 [Rosa chinensis]
MVICSFLPFLLLLLLMSSLSNQMIRDSFFVFTGCISSIQCEFHSFFSFFNCCSVIFSLD